MSLILTFDSNVRSTATQPERNLTVPQFSLLGLLITLAAIAGDQWVAPALHSSSPLWATAACLALVWRRGDTKIPGDVQAARLNFSFLRITLFVLAHASLICAARFLASSIELAAGTMSFAGWLTAILKLSVLFPLVFLLPLKQWRIFARVYAAEGIAGVVVLLTFFPSRVLTAIWPWYGQMLGKSVFYFAALFVPGLAYSPAFTPTIHGPALDVTILYACSGISGIELFDYLFAFVVLLDWNRLRKGRTLLAYFGGAAAMFIGNALRISALVIFGNRGFSDTVAHFHISAGWIFFSVVFLSYLSLTYRKLLVSTK